ncbi:hypothetical protein MTR_6g004890 [Medicago truncatula]|uniref:Uncharacterized protein n=1 Tax=Medicago truncatula TaxID=3880 RepID=A0A072U6M7_MEDTR|nr:hypothetical protein MTR_6g004890 [Medicago truncatula]
MYVSLEEEKRKLRGIKALNLSHTSVKDGTLYVITIKSCSGLLQLYLENCCRITELEDIDSGDSIEKVDRYASKPENNEDNDYVGGRGA